MSVVVDDTQICNYALSLITESQINSIDADNTTAKQCKQFYAQARDAALSKIQPNWSIKQRQLAADGTWSTTSTLLEYQWSYRYEVPSGNDDYYLTLVKINQYYAEDAEGQYELNGSTDGHRHLYTNWEAPLYIRYVFRNKNVSIYEPAFVDYVAYSLAIRLAPLKQRSSTQKQALLDEFNSMIAPEAYREKNRNRGDLHNGDDSKWLQNFRRSSSLSNKDIIYDL